MAQDLFLSDLGIFNAIGSGCEEVFGALMRGDHHGPQAEVHGEKTFHVCRSSAPGASTRLNNLLSAACDQIMPSIRRAVERYGSKRIGVILGSTDNGAEESRLALAAFLSQGSFPAGYSLVKQEAHYASQFLAEYAGLGGPVFAISTACTSSGSAIANAARLINIGFCDAVLAGGADIVSDAVLLGFHALEAVDLEPSRPFSATRRGINLGEGAALFLLAREDFGDQGIRLLGCGESADAHHMTAPDPQGGGAMRAMRAALAEAHVSKTDIDYINLHGTGTQLNDAMEAIATAEVMGNNIPCSSTKSLVGHTLGAAAAMELGFCWLALSDLNSDGLIPPHVWDGQFDPTMPRLDFAEVGRKSRGLRICMSNSYAFGGCNVSLLLGRA